MKKEVKLYVEKLPKNCSECPYLRDYKCDVAPSFKGSICTLCEGILNNDFINSQRMEYCPLHEITRDDVEHFDSELDLEEIDANPLPEWAVLFLTTPEDKQGKILHEEFKRLFNKQPKYVRKSILRMVKEDYNGD